MRRPVKSCSTLAALLLAALASPAAAQDVACVAATLSLEQLQSLSTRYVSLEIGPEDVAEALRPGIKSCVDRGVIVTQAQVDASFSYTIAAIEILDYGKDLQSFGIDPATIEVLWERMAPPLRGAVLAYMADSTLVLPEEELKAYLSENSTADENGRLGTALVFILAIASSVNADQNFTAAKPQ